jgi:Tol biopolymer transport system component
VALDERLRGELDRAAQPADPSGIYEQLIRRRERRRIARKMQSGVLAVVVLVGSIGGFVALTRIFRETKEPPPVATPSASNDLIVFSLPLEDGGEHLFAVGADGLGLRQLTPGGGAVYRSPDVSPDGRTIVVVHEIPSFEPGYSVLATVPIEGGSPTWLTNEAQVVRDPVWSPDGRSIAFAGEIPGEPFGLYVLDPDTGDAYLIPGTDNILSGEPTWSPDGERLAFEGASPEPGDGSRDAWDIYTVRLDGSELTNLTRTPDESEVWPAWSWVTDRIAFVRGVPRGAGVYTMAPDGSDRTLVFDALPNLGSPAWSPDGTMIAFSADTGQVYTVSVDGTNLRAVTGALGEPAWQAVPDEEVPVPTPSPQPTPSPTPRAGEDIGLGIRLCDVTSVRGTFLSAYGEGQTAFVGTPLLPDGSCPPNEFEMEGVAAIDLTGDGTVDISSDPFTCQNGCNVFAAPDIDGDGNDELLVQNVQFSIVGLKLFKVVPNKDEPALLAVTVQPPGDAPFGFQRFEGNEEPQFWIGGDAFSADALRCEAGEGGRLLISTTAESLPNDSIDAMWFATETTFILEGGEVRVLSVREYETSLDDRSPFVTTGCGADLDPYR